MCKIFNSEKKICIINIYLATIFEKDTKRRENNGKKDVYACSCTVTGHFFFFTLDFLNLETFFLSVEVVATFAKQMEQFEFERNTTTTFICRIDEL